MTKPVADLASGKCKPCEDGVAPLKENDFICAAKLDRLFDL